METISIVTLNSWKCDGDYPARLKLMTAEAARLRPDIMLLQEAFRADGTPHDTAAALADTLRHQCAYLPARTKHRTWRGGEGVCSSGQAVLTAGAIEDTQTVTLPDDPRDGERLAQMVTISIDGLRLLIVNLHLCYLDDRDDLRRDELENLRDALPDLSTYDAVVMGGDFNCTWDSPPMRWLVKDSGLAIHNPVATAFDTCGGFNNDRPPHCIDFLLQVESGGACVLEDGAPAFDAPDAAGMYPSDHIGVRAVLRKSRNTRAVPSR
jgi:endonuclease/exonuclease/phosphatase family metal-dependent hydrolase